MRFIRMVDGHISTNFANIFDCYVRLFLLFLLLFIRIDSCSLLIGLTILLHVFYAPHVHTIFSVEFFSFRTVFEWVFDKLLVVGWSRNSGYIFQTIWNFSLIIFSLKFFFFKKCHAMPIVINMWHILFHIIFCNTFCFCLASCNFDVLIIIFINRSIHRFDAWFVEPTRTKKACLFHELRIHFLIP